MELYKKFIPLQKHIKRIKKIYMRKIEMIVRKKCPLYFNSMVESLSGNQEEGIADLSDGTAEEVVEKSSDKIKKRRGIDEFKI